MTVIAPSLLSADYARLADDIAMISPVSDWFHVDIMDGHFVPNITIGPPVVASIRKVTGIYLDCHLMITDPVQFLPAFADAGADGCSVHIEVGNTEAAIAKMRELGLDVGLALNPATPFETAEPFLDRLDYLLLMTVVPGFGGQSFITDVVPKIEQARKTIDAQGLSCPIQVDGGINQETAAVAARAGATVFVAGNAIFAQPDPIAAATAIRTAATL